MAVLLSFFFYFCFFGENVALTWLHRDGATEKKKVKRKDRERGREGERSTAYEQWPATPRRIPQLTMSIFQIRPNNSTQPEYSIANQIPYMQMRQKIQWMSHELGHTQYHVQVASLAGPELGKDVSSTVILSLV